MWRWAAEGAPDSSEDDGVRAKRGIRVIIVSLNNEQHPRPERSDQTEVVHTTFRLLLPRMLCAVSKPRYYDYHHSLPSFLIKRPSFFNLPSQVQRLRNQDQ